MASLSGHTSYLAELHLLTSSNVPLLLSAGWDGRLVLWNLQTMSIFSMASLVRGYGSF